MSHPLRANLIIAGVEGGAQWVCCAKCGHQYCRAGENWREHSKIRLLEPTKAGALMSVLKGQYLLRQLYCPSCAVLLDTDFIEEDARDSRGA
jgi:acetone carboxylase gamma subunit